MPENNDSLTPDTGNLNATSDLSSDGLNAAPLSNDQPHYSGSVDMTGQPIDPPSSYEDLPEPADLTSNLSLGSLDEDIQNTQGNTPMESSFDNSLESGLGEEPAFGVGGSDNLNASAEPVSTGGSGNGGRMKFLLLTTGLLMLALAGAVWFFFLRDDGGTATPTPTPSPTTAAGSTTPTPIAGGTGQTHLECRFGLCVEVPGPGTNMCSSSFDCEDDGTGGTPAPTSAASTPTRAPSVTAAATTVPSPTSALGAPQATNTPTMTPTRTPSPTPRITTATTVTPTPLAPVLPESGAVSQTLVLALSSLVLVGGGFTLAKKKSEQ